MLKGYWVRRLTGAGRGRAVFTHFLTDNSSGSGKFEARELHVQRGLLNFSVAPAMRAGDASEYSIPHLPFFSSICTCVLLMITQY